MKISELIAELEEAKAKLGDIKVVVCDDCIARDPSMHDKHEASGYDTDYDGALRL